MAKKPYSIPLDKDGLPDIRAIGSKAKPGRHNVTMSCHAAADYLELKMQLLNLDAPIDLSDSAMIELLVYCATYGEKATRVVWSDWRPVTKDYRRSARLHSATSQPKEEGRGIKRLIDAVQKRKETTRERLDFFRAYPEAARERKSRLVRRARRKHLREAEESGAPVRRRDGGLQDPPGSE